jgi:uncharacterized lipoprotein YmbA
MKTLRAATCAGMAFMFSACGGPTDHFYTLSVAPVGQQAPAAPFTTHVVLMTSLPPVIDRREMVVHTSPDQLLILEHERWAAPMSELVTQTLARDLEQRRPGVLVGDRGFDQAKTPSIRLKVDIVQMSARRGGNAVLEAHWRIVDPQSDVDQLGGEVFSAPVSGEDYAAIAAAFSTCLASLADRLADKLTVH